MVNEILLKGKENAIPASVLVEVLELGGIRQLQKAIETERKNGVVICSCSDGSGYYLPKDTTEVLEFYRFTRKKAISTLATLKSARAALQNVEGQIDFDETDDCF